MVYLENLGRSALQFFVGGMALAASMATQSGARADCEPDPYIGSVCVTAGSYCPRQYTEMQGQIMPVYENTALFSLISDIYGGNGHSTFGLPYGQGRTLISEGRGPGLPYYPLGAYDGTEYRIINEYQLPPHTHGATFVPTDTGVVTQEVAVLPGTLDLPVAGVYKGGTVKGTAAVPAYVASADAGATVKLGGVETTVETSPPTVLSTAGVEYPTVDTIQPQLGLRYCVAEEGRYPPRP